MLGPHCLLRPNPSQAWTCSLLTQVRGAPPSLSLRQCLVVPIPCLGVRVPCLHHLLWVGRLSFPSGRGRDRPEAPLLRTFKQSRCCLWRGFRRAQEAEKTGTKGTLASIQEAEKLDVLLARGCGELTVELCKGVYGKELFHSIKRAGHHAKHALILKKWPVHITNRLALSIAGLWWGGKNPTLSSCLTAPPFALISSSLGRHRPITRSRPGYAHQPVSSCG